MGLEFFRSSIYAVDQSACAACLFSDVGCVLDETESPFDGNSVMKYTNG